MQQRRLGRGLDSLLEGGSSVAEEGRAASASSGSQSVFELDIEKVSPNPDQPRKEFDQTALDELADSIAEKGVIQPILVRQTNDGSYQIIAGERRYRASKQAGKSTIPAIVKSYGEEETLEVALIENLQREDLNPIEEALAFKQLIERFSMGQEQIAKKIGKNRSTVANSLRLLKLPQSVQDAISQGNLSAGHARAVLSVSTGDDAQTALFKAIVDEGLSVRDAEAMAKLLNQGNSPQNALESTKSRSINGATNGEGSDAIFGGELELNAAMDKSRGATIVQSDSQAKTAERRATELWDMEEKLIMALGTRVQIKGDTKTGKIEINYYSMEDLERIYDIVAKQK